MSVKKQLLAILAAGLLVGPMAAQAIVISSPSQTGIENPLTFTFSGLQPSAGTVTVSVFAEGDLAFDPNEFLNVSMGPSGGSLTNFGNHFGSLAGLTTYDCGIFACARGTVDFLLTDALFNSWGSSLRVLLTPGSGVNNFAPNSAQVTLSYTPATRVAEPGTLALIGLGLIALGLARRRRAN
jgi:hypothetical protein